MALLSRTSRAMPPVKRADAPGPALVRVGECVAARLCGAEVVALPHGALWIAEASALVVADLHFEKGSAFAKAGQMLPPYDTRMTLARLVTLIARCTPDIVISLGDAFHDGGGPGRMDVEERRALELLVGSVDWVWVEGNHDGASAQTLGGIVHHEVRLGPFVLRHEPTGESGEIAGHLHPCAKVAGRGRNVRRRCFALDGDRMVLPAFGAYTGGLNICGDAFARIFPDRIDALVLGRDKVMPVRWSRLAPD